MKGVIVENAPPPPTRSETQSGSSEYDHIYKVLSEKKSIGDYVAVSFDVSTMTQEGISAARNACGSSVKGWFLRQRKQKKFAGFHSLSMSSKLSEDRMKLTIWFILL